MTGNNKKSESGITNKLCMAMIVYLLTLLVKLTLTLKQSTSQSFRIYFIRFNLILMSVSRLYLNQVSESSRKKENLE